MRAEPGRRILKQPAAKLEPVIVAPEEKCLRPLPNADFLSSDWFMRLWEGQPFSFEIILVMSL